MNKQCEIVQDLLPLYVDGACSDASVELVEKHLKDCPVCDEIYQKMCSRTGEKILQSERENIITHHKRRENQKLVKYMFWAMILLYGPTLLMISFLADGVRLFTFALLTIYTFPFYIAFIELGLAACRALEKQPTTKGSRIWHGIGILLAVGILLIAALSHTVLQRPEMIFPMFGASILLILKWIAYAIIYKRKPHFEMGKQRAFWLCVLILAVAVFTVIFSCYIYVLNQNERENRMEYTYVISSSGYGSEYEGVSIKAESAAWELFGGAPHIQIRWINETEKNIQYTEACYIYKQTDDGWGLCSTDYITFPEGIFTVEAGSTRTHAYVISDYDISESGRYRFVTFVEGKAVWLEFELTILQAVGH